MSRRVSEAAAMLGRRGGKARAESMASWERRESARIAANARWAAVRRQACPVCGFLIGGGKMARSSAGICHVECVTARVDLQIYRGENHDVDLAGQNGGQAPR